MPQRIAVIIPFFQRQPGVLSQAIASVLAQEGVADIRIIVVDDSSPVPAVDELVRFGPAPRFPIRIIGRPNGGPGAARNSGLDAVDADTEHVAFLDSDDVWSPDHLRNALFALEHGYDFYFADIRERDRSKSHFEEGDIEHLRDYPRLPENSRFIVPDRRFFGQTIEFNIIGPSTVVYRFRKMPSPRFAEDIWLGEDRLFWLDLLYRTDLYICSTGIEAIMGSGVNIYRSQTWGSEAWARGLQHQIAMRKQIAAHFDLDPTLARFNTRALARLRKQWGVNLFHCVLHGKSLSASTLREPWRRDPATFAMLPAAALTMLGARVKSHK